MLRRVALPALLVLATACGGSTKGAGTVTVGGDRVTVARLVDAHAALCQAAADPSSARRLFFDRAHEALHTVARGVEGVDRAQAAVLLQAKEKVESELDSGPPSLVGDLLALADVYRSALGRLAITAPACVR